MTRLLTCLASIVVLVAFGSASAQDPRTFYKGARPFTLAPRIALVIGVSSASEGGVFSSLPNPVNDAAEIATALRGLGFSVLSPQENYAPSQITRQLVKRYLYDFALLLKETRGAIGLVYYSGHGIELYGQNFLVAHDGYVRYARDLQEELIPVSWFYDAFRFAGNKLNLLFVDACRTFPWNELPEFGTPLRLDKSLVEAENVLRAYATLSGKPAFDGTGKTSPYAAAFLETLKQPDLTLGEVYRAIAQHTQMAAPRLQITKAEAPGRYDFILHPTEDTFKQESLIYTAARQSENRALLERIVTRYSHGYFALSAEDLLRTIPERPRPSSTYIELRNAANLRELPQAGSRIVAAMAAGEQLGVEDEVRKYTVPAWIPVRWGPRDELAYVEAKAAARTKFVAQAYPLQFQGGASGAPEYLSDAARATIVGAIKDRGRVRRVEIKSYVYQQPDASGSSALHRLPLRQAVVLEALQDAGYGSGNVQTPVVAAPDAQSDGAVELVVARAVREP